DRTVLPAKQLGYNERNDYCLLKVEAPKPLPFFEMGNSDEIQVGDWVMALGHPGGANIDRKASCSLGRVTELHFKLPAQSFQRYYGNAIKSDTPIFSGNSGGPLVDMDGKLIGINAAILIQNEDSFSIPIGEVREVLPILKEGKVLTGYRMNEYPSALVKRLPSSRNGFLGVRSESVPEQMKSVLEISGGAYIREVLEGSPASEAGLQLHDVILQIDAKAIRDPYHLSETIRSYKPFTQALFKVMRQGEVLSLQVRLGRQ
ncbi:MAG: trypsin-like peptidase domain-containing protein, partial [Planctomycetota bacterium]